MPSSRGSSQPRDPTQISYIAGKDSLMTEPPGNPILFSTQHIKKIFTPGLKLNNISNFY